MCKHVEEPSVVVTLCRKDRLHHILPVTIYYAEVVVVIFNVQTHIHMHVCPPHCMSGLFLSQVERQIYMHTHGTLRREEHVNICCESLCSGHCVRLNFHQ